ncbi:MAG: transcriptional regulator, partial [Lachnospiraceae bacterium]|nr:transcriptional regulator [Lachnospiraceae bacterium]
MSDVFIKILNMSLSASWLILAVIVLRFLLRKAPKWSMCLLWALAAIKLVIPFSPESVLSLIPSNEVIPQNITMESHPHINSGIVYLDTAVNPVMESNLSPQPGDSANPIQVVMYMAGIVWCTGVILCLAYALVSYILLRRKVRASKRIEDRIYSCDEVASPFILGVFRPVIYIPSGISREITDYVIAHENAHLKRGDHFWKPLGFIILSVYWFNPLCWIAYILLCRDIEYACDEKVIRDKDREYANSYSQALLDCNAQRRIIAACPLA